MLMDVAVSRPQDRPDPGDPLFLRSGQEGLGRPPAILTGPGNARGDEARDQRRREGRATPPRHAAEDPILADVRRLTAHVVPGRVRINQALTRGIYVDPRTEVTEIGSIPAIGAKRPDPDHPGKGRGPERPAGRVVPGGRDHDQALVLAITLPEDLEAQQRKILAAGRAGRQADDVRAQAQSLIEPFDDLILGKRT